MILNPAAFVVVLGVATVVATVIAVQKHESLSAAKASAKNEADNLEALLGKVHKSAKGRFLGVINRLRGIV
jgi:hypothetical protein